MITGAIGVTALTGFLVVKYVWPKISSGASLFASSVVALASNIVDHASFVSEMWKAINASNASGFPLQARLYMLAMAAYETGWGSQVGFHTTNNAFNITAGPTWSGPTTQGGDTECDANGQNCKPITQSWRVYPDLISSVNDFLQFIQASRYADAYQRLSNGDLTFVDVLHTGGYFTANVDTYRNNVASIANTTSSMVSGLWGFHLEALPPSVDECRGQISAIAEWVRPRVAA